MNVILNVTNWRKSCGWWQCRQCQQSYIPKLLQHFTSNKTLYPRGNVLGKAPLGRNRAPGGPHPGWGRGFSSVDFTFLWVPQQGPPASLGTCQVGHCVNLSLSVSLKMVDLGNHSNSHVTNFTSTKVEDINVRKVTTSNKSIRKLKWCTSFGWLPH